MRVPEMIGRYRVQRRLGEGGTGVVYLAISPSGRQVAVKMIRRALADDATLRARFRQEVSAARKVSGAFTAPVVDADMDADDPWMAVLYVDGTSLRERITTSGPLPAEEVWELACGLAEALQDIHAAGLVHRDLKPSNVIITSDGPRVIDFGISRSTEESRGITTTGAFLGTPPFMAPEQVRDAKTVGPPADVFALGSLLAYAATGRGPFDTHSALTTAYNIVYEAPDLAGVPPLLEPLINACLAKDPAQRPAPGQLLDHLVAGRSLHSSRGRLNARLPGRRTLLRAGVPGAVFALLVAAAFVWLPDRGVSNAAANSWSTRVVEPTAALRPKGWALFETRLFEGEDALYAHPWCTSAAGALVCGSESLWAARIDQRTGAVLWKVEHSGADRDARFIGVAGGNLILVAGEKEVLTALDPMTGGTRWTKTLTGRHEDPVLIGDVGYVTIETPRTSLIALDMRTGHQIAERKKTGPVIRTDDRNLYISDYRAGNLAITCLDPTTLKPLWTRRDVDNRSWLIHVAGTRWTMISSGSSSDGGRVAELIHWNRETGTEQRIPLQEPVAGEAQFIGDVLYVTRRNGDLHAIDTNTGRTLWSRPTGIDSPGPLVGEDGRIYVVGADGRLASFDAGSGRTVWRSAQRSDPDAAIGRIFATPVLGDGIVYAASARGTVFGIRPPAR